MGDKRDLKGLKGYLQSRILGQGDAIGRIAQALASAECELNERGQRPRGAFLLMGRLESVKPKRPKRSPNTCSVRIGLRCFL
jgi:ATP-dependent Clp protease ATP-binding subunit ClpA